MPSAFPILGPFSFLCHQKWDSASKVPLIPRDIPILMLSGARDEVVPAEHMKELWDIVQKRTLAGQGSETETEQEGKTVHEARGRGGYSKFVEFEWGTHSKCFEMAHVIVVMLTFLIDDTCVQPGYWQAVSQFINKLQ